MDLGKTNLSLLPEVIGLMDESMERIEPDINQLIEDPSYTELMNDIYREVHSIKGNFAMCQCDPLVNYAHKIEEVLSAVKKGSFPCSGVIGEVILLSLDRLREMAVQVSNVRTLAGFEPGVIEEELMKLPTCPAAQADELAIQIIDLMSGRYAPTTETDNPVDPTEKNISADLDADLAFFARLSKLFDNKNPFWSGRTEFQMTLAMAINRAAGKPINEKQLAAAVYLHDFGMALLPESQLQKMGKYEANELEGIHAHPVFASEILMRMPNWQPASVMVMQHHERVDGRGYPKGLKEDAICDGAKILAIVDAFFSMTNPRADRTYGKSLLRAVSEINACANAQFSKKWVDVFNGLAMEKIRQQNKKAA